MACNWTKIFYFVCWRVYMQKESCQFQMLIIYTIGTKTVYQMQRIMKYRTKDTVWQMCKGFLCCYRNWRNTQNTQRYTTIGYMYFQKNATKCQIQNTQNISPQRVAQNARTQNVMKNVFFAPAIIMYYKNCAKTQ